MIFNNTIFIFLFFAIFTEIINYLFNNNVLNTSNSINETKFIVIINNIELSVYPFFKLEIIENTNTSLKVCYQNIEVVYNKVNSTEENKAYLKYNNQYYLPIQDNLLIYSPFLQLNEIFNSINICGINELFIYINSFENDNEGTSSSTNEGTSSSTNEGTSSSTNESTSSSTNEGTSSSTNEGTSSSTNEGTSSSTNEGTSSSTNEGTSSSTNEGTSSSTNEGTSSSTNEGTSSSTNEGTSSSTNEGTSSSYN